MVVEDQTLSSDEAIMSSNNTIEGTGTIDDVTQQQTLVEGDDNNVGTTTTTTTTSSIVINDNDETIPIVAMEDVWATSAGYTPLQDFMINHNNNNNDDDDDNNIDVHGAFFSDGVSGGTIYTSLPGAFYANIGHNNNETWDREEDDDGYQDYNYLHDIDDDDEDLEATMATTSSTSFYDSEDFRSVADNALLMLDREYHHVVSQEPLSILPPLHIDNTHSSTDIVSDEINSKEQVSSLNNDTVNNLEHRNEDDTKPTVEQQQQHDQEQPTQPKLIPNIDTEAVRRAVQTIQLKNPQFEENLRLWESKQLQPKMGKKLPLPIMYENKNMSTKNYKMAPRLHPIIPEIPLKAFRTGTAKAIQATANLTRSACIAEALYRFNILQYHVGIEQTVRIHILGCDHVECGYHNNTCNGNQCDIMQIRTLFGPIVRWMGAYAEAPSHIRIDLIGPNIPQNVARATTTEPIDLLPTKNCSSLKECLQSATLRCHSGVYEDIMNDTSNDLGQPDLIIAFNAGIWGYQEWETSIKYLIQRSNNIDHQTIPFIVTAYTIEEAEDDYDTISDIVDKCKSIELQKQVQCVWDVEQNSFASNQIRTTTSAVISTTKPNPLTDVKI